MYSPLSSERVSPRRPLSSFGLTAQMARLLKPPEAVRLRRRFGTRMHSRCYRRASPGQGVTEYRVVRVSRRVPRHWALREAEHCSAAPNTNGRREAEELLDRLHPVVASTVSATGSRAGTPAIDVSSATSTFASTWAGVARGLSHARNVVECGRFHRRGHGAPTPRRVGLSAAAVAAVGRRR